MKYQQRKLYVGIDVHSREHKVALMPISLLEGHGARWKRSKTLSIRNNIDDFMRLDAAIMSHVASAEEVAIAVDHTGGYYSEPLVHFLLAKGYSVYHLESKAIKATRERLLDEENKSDVIDSSGAAFMLYLRDLHRLSFCISEVTPELTSKAAALNSLVLQRCQFNKLLNQTTNRLHQLLLAVFPEGEAQYFRQLLEVTPYYPTPGDMVNSSGLFEVKKLRQKDRLDLLKLASNTVGVPGDRYGWLIKEVSTQRKYALVKLEILTAILRTQVRAHPYGDLLLSFPYIGEIAAATIIAIMKDIARWPDKKKFKKSLGVYSSSTQSGNSPVRTKQGKEGSRHGRRVLFQVCLGCITLKAPENDFKDHYYRQVRRGKVRIKALVSTMGKLAEIIYHCLKTGESYRYQGIYR